MHHFLPPLLLPAVKSKRTWLIHTGIGLGLLNLTIMQTLQAQSTAIDSMRASLETKLPDTVRLKTMDRLALEYFNHGDLESARHMCEAVFTFVDSIPHPKNKTWYTAEAFAYSLLGSIAYSLGNYDTSLVLHQKALDLEKQADYEAGAANEQMSMAVIDWAQGRYPEALSKYLDVLRIFEKLNDSTGLADVLNNMGGLYEYQEEWEEARKCYQKSLNIAIALQDKRAMAGCYNNLGNLYDYQHYYEVSLEYHFKAHDLYKEIDFPQGIADADDNIANTYSKMQRYADESQYRLESIRIREQLGDKLGLATSQANSGNMYVALKKYTIAIPYFEKSLALANALGATDRIQDAYLGLAQSYKGLHDYKKALDYHIRYAEIRDTLHNEEKSRQIAEMKQKYESEKKDVQIQLLAKEHEILLASQRRKILIRNISLSVFALLSAVLFGRYRIYQKLQIEKLRNKISKDLHDDIGSTLSSISISSAAILQLAKDDQAIIVNTIRQIGENAKSALENMSDIVWALNPAHQALGDITERLLIYATGILDARNIRLQMDIPQSMEGMKLSIDQRKNIYLILREAINNTAKYSRATTCQINAYLENRLVTLVVKDDGLGFESQERSLGGNGLTNIRQRAHELKAKLNIDSHLHEGTAITLRFRA